MNKFTGKLKIMNLICGFMLIVTSVIFSTALYSQERKLDNQKTLNVAIPSAATGFDPAKTDDLYSSMVFQNIFDSLLTYDYLARPSKPQNGQNF